MDSENDLRRVSRHLLRALRAIFAVYFPKIPLEIRSVSQQTPMQIEYDHMKRRFEMYENISSTCVRPHKNDLRPAQAVVDHQRFCFIAVLSRKIF